MFIQHVPGSDSFLRDTSKTKAELYKYALDTPGKQENSEHTGKCISVIFKRLKCHFTKWKQCHQNQDFFLRKYSDCLDRYE
jgi:hypothetical protein